MILTRNLRKVPQQQKIPSHNNQQKCKIQSNKIIQGSQQQRSNFTSKNAKLQKNTKINDKNSGNSQLYNHGNFTDASHGYLSQIWDQHQQLVQDISNLTKSGYKWNANGQKNNTTQRQQTQYHTVNNNSQKLLIKILQKLQTIQKSYHYLSSTISLQTQKFQQLNSKNKFQREGQNLSQYGYMSNPNIRKNQQSENSLEVQLNKNEKFVDKVNQDMHGSISTLKKSLETSKQLDLSNSSLQCIQFITKHPKPAFASSIKSLNLSNNLLKFLPASIANLVNLLHLNISLNPICVMPVSLLELIKLKQLIINYCSLYQLPLGIDRLKDLTKIQICGCGIKTLPQAFGRLANLQVLILNFNQELESLGNSLGSLSKLRYFQLKGNKKLRELPTSFNRLKSLSEFHLTLIGMLVARKSSFQGIKTLKKLYIYARYDSELEEFKEHCLANAIQLKYIKIISQFEEQSQDRMFKSILIKKENLNSPKSIKQFVDKNRRQMATVEQKLNKKIGKNRYSDIKNRRKSNIIPKQSHIVPNNQSQIFQQYQLMQQSGVKNSHNLQWKSEQQLLSQQQDLQTQSNYDLNHDKKAREVRQQQEKPISENNCSQTNQFYDQDYEQMPNNSKTCRNNKLNQYIQQGQTVSNKLIIKQANKPTTITTPHPTPKKPPNAPIAPKQKTPQPQPQPPATTRPRPHGHIRSSGRTRLLSNPNQGTHSNVRSLRSVRSLKSFKEVQSSLQGIKELRFMWAGFGSAINGKDRF